MARIKMMQDETGHEGKIYQGPRTKEKVARAIPEVGGSIETSGSGNIRKRRQKMRNIKNVEKEILQYIIGQDEQVRQALTAIYTAMYMPSLKSNMLIIGKTGVGKTEMIKQIAKRLKIPYTIEDATKYTKEGYYGADVDDMVYNLLRNADFDAKRAQRGIIIIDEIDKKVGEDMHDVSGVEVLNSLLKIIEGTTMIMPAFRDPFDDEEIQFDTSHLIIIFMGAFSGLEKIREKRLNINQLGFSTGSTAKENSAKSKFLKSDLIKYGMPDEFVGRINTIIEMNPLTVEDLTTIVEKSKLSIFRRYQNDLRGKGIELQYNEILFNEIAKEAMDLDLGSARELTNVVNRMFSDIMYQIFATERKYTKCELSSDIIKDSSKYKLS